MSAPTAATATGCVMQTRRSGICPDGRSTDPQLCRNDEACPFARITSSTIDDPSLTVKHPRDVSKDLLRGPGSVDAAESSPLSVEVQHRPCLLAVGSEAAVEGGDVIVVASGRPRALERALLERRLWCLQGQDADGGSDRSLEGSRLADVDREAVDEDASVGPRGAVHSPAEEVQHVAVVDEAARRHDRCDLSPEG